MMALGSRIDDIIKAGRQAAQQSQRVISHRTTQAAVNNLDETIKAAKNIVNNMGNGTTQTVVRNFDDQVKNAKNVINNNTTAPSRYDTRGSYQQALEKAKEIANTNTTTRAMNNNTRNAQNTANHTVNNTPRMPIINTTMPNGGPQTTSIINNTPVNRNIPINTSEPPRYGPYKDGGSSGNTGNTRYGPYNTNTSGSGGGNNNNNNRTHTSSGPDGGPRNNGNNNSNANNNTNTNTNTNTNSGPNTDSGPEPEGFDYKGFFGDTVFGGVTDSYKGIRDGGPFWDTIKAAHTNDDGSLRWGRVAGSYMAASTAGRIISGGGLTRDRNGNPNFPGIPFI